MFRYRYTKTKNVISLFSFDVFDSNHSGWNITSDKKCFKTIENGKYHIKNRDKENIRQSLIAVKNSSSGNFIIKADIKKTTRGKNHLYSLIWGKTNKYNYNFLTLNNGSLRRYGGLTAGKVKNGKVQRRCEWLSNKKIDYQDNTITIVHLDDTVSIAINDEFVVQYASGSALGDSIGFGFLGRLDLEFDNVSVIEPQPQTCMMLRQEIYGDIYASRPPTEEEKSGMRWLVLLLLLTGQLGVLGNG